MSSGSVVSSYDNYQIRVRLCLVTGGIFDGGSSCSLFEAVYKGVSVVVVVGGTVVEVVVVGACRGIYS
jgi:hypothetical protein